MIHDYMLQLNGATFAGLAASSADLIITESGLNAQAGVTPTLTGAELASLGAQGKVVVGYVNTCATDHNRSYWNPAWVTYTDPAEKDVGVVTAAAPTWLSGNLGTVDFAPEAAGQPAAPEAFLVDYRNQDWRNLVISQTVAVVSAGYGGADIFVFDTRLSAANIDRISDFDTAADHIALENAIFTGLAAGALQGSAFVGNLTGMATTAAQYILYETDTGALFFDANGSGAGGRQQFATLMPGLALTAGDFLVL